MASGVQLVNHSDVVATAAAFNVEVKLAQSGSTSSASSVASHVSTGGQSDVDQSPVTVASTILAAATATLSATVNNDGGTEGGRIHQLDQGVDSLMKKMGIHSTTTHAYCYHNKRMQGHICGEKAPFENKISSKRRKN